MRSATYLPVGSGEPPFGSSVTMNAATSDRSPWTTAVTSPSCGMNVGPATIEPSECIIQTW